MLFLLKSSIGWPNLGPPGYSIGSSSCIYFQGPRNRGAGTMPWNVLGTPQKFKFRIREKWKFQPHNWVNKQSRVKENSKLYFWDPPRIGDLFSKNLKNWRFLLFIIIRPPPKVKIVPGPLYIALQKVTNWVF